MEILKLIAQTIVGLGIINVWLVRFRSKTPYRAGGSSSMKEEFAVYGLSEGVMWIVGIVKVSAAIALLVGIAAPHIVPTAASCLALLMLVAVAMHIKVKDPAIKSLPATAVLLLSFFIAVG